MKMKKAILSCLMLVAGLTASAQEQKGTTEYVFEPHWYVNIQPVGVQYTLGEIDFGDLLSYNVQATVGREFNKVIGARLAINAWQSKAGSRIFGYDYKWKWNYIAPTVDIPFNISNLISGVNPNRVFTFGAFAGIGANIAWGNDQAQDVNKELKALTSYTYDVYAPNGENEGTPTIVYVAGEDGLAYLWDGTKTRLLLQAGLTGDIKINDKFAVTLEVSANTLNDKYNSKKAKNWDWYFNALAGLKINLGPTYSTKFIPAPEPEIRYVEKIVEKVVEVPAPAPEPAAEPLRRDIFFLINKADIRTSEAQKVNDIVAYLNENKDAKVQVTGYADAGTGNDKINDRLAKGRADVVVKALKEQYGIAESRISFDSKGSRVQPFADNDSNRVSICIAE
jgi:outer membrane protein OmpA-like peptidoglycan-associated protein